MLKRATRKARLPISNFVFFRAKFFCSEQIGTNVSKFASENQDSCLSKNKEASTACVSKVPPAPSPLPPLTFSSSSLLGAPKPNESNGEQLTEARASGIKDEPQGQEQKRAILGAGAGASGSLHFHGRDPASED